MNNNMLIIMNPPYGLNNSLAKKIIPQALQVCEKAVVLVPKNTYKDIECWKCVEEITLVDNVFEDAKIESLSIAKLNKDFDNKRSLADICLNKKQRRLFDVIMKYNETHGLTYSTVGLLGTFEKDLDKSIRLQQKIVPTQDGVHKTIREARDNQQLFAYTKWTPQDGVHKTIREARDNQQLFAYTKWTPQNGVHKDEAYDIQWNIHNEWPPYKKAGLPINAIYFQTKVERDNFRDWWYSCLKGQNGKKERIGLTNAFLGLIAAIEGGSSAGYDKYFPHLDWSRPWTDKEILKEIGLPENF